MTTFALKESMLDVHASCVVVVVDVHTTLWSLRQQFGTQEFLKLEDVSSLVSVYCNTISLMHRKNKVYVIFHNAEGTRIVYAPQSGDASEEPNKTLADAVQEAFDLEIKRMLERPADVESLSTVSSSQEKKMGLSQALGRALCILNKQLILYRKLQTRICVIQLAKDQSDTYTPVMNCIFSAQKQNTIVDCLNLGRSPSSFLQQAAYLTGGVYLYDEDDQRDLFHLLLTHCVASNHTRGSFKTLQQKTIDFKASCFCHGKPHEFMYMCPVCLSLICSQKYDELMKSDNPACITCEVPLNLKSNANSNKRSRTYMSDHF